MGCRKKADTSFATLNVNTSYVQLEYEIDSYNMGKKQSHVIQRTILFLMIFQSIGLRLFQGIGITLLIIIFILALPKARFSKVLKPYLIIEAVYLVLSVLKGIEVKSIIINSAAIFDACLFISMYRDFHSLVDDLYAVLRIYCLQAFISIPVFLLVPESALKILNNDGMMITPRTFAYLFYYPMEKSILGFPRISGWCWEPGTFQLVANMFLLLKIIRRDSIKSMAWVVFVILSTFSTLAYFCLLLNIVAAIWNSKRRAMMTFVILLSVPLASGIFMTNISEKLGDDNTSGLIRKRDIFIGMQIVKENPILGYDTDKLETSRDATKLEDKFWATNSNLPSWTQYSGYFAGGYTNGFFGALMSYGLIIGLFLFYCIYRIPLFEKKRERLCVLVFWVMSLQSESVSIYCSFFYLFVMLGFIEILSERKKRRTPNYKLSEYRQ